MTKDKGSTEESLKQLLDWLSTDSAVAGAKYEEIRHSLIKIFIWNKCSDAESLADETFDRVAKKMPGLAQTYVGDPALYFYGVARNLLKEDIRKSNLYVPAEEDLAATPEVVDDSPRPEQVYDCLERCLKKLSAEDRRLVLNYYRRERQDKIDFRKKLADELGITLNALRVKLFRIRATLEQCIEDCLRDENNDEIH